MSLNYEELSLLSSILSIIDNREWPWLDHYIVSNSHGFQVFARAVAESPDLNGLTLCKCKTAQQKVLPQMSFSLYF
jgi:hypothetical protein